MPGKRKGRCVTITIILTVVGAYTSHTTGMQ